MLLDVSHLTVRYGGQAPAVSDVSFQLDNGEIFAVVGESGSGKSTVLRTIIGLLPENGYIAGGSICFAGRELTGLSPARWQKIRGNRIGYVFQDAGASLNPVRKIGSQFTEFIRCHRSVSRHDAKDLELDIMRRLNLSDGDRILRSYPSQLSGGMKQRVSLAMAMATGPELIIADEPTSALDTVSQAQIMRELLFLKESFGTAILLVTHNIGVAAHIADKIGIMRSGAMLECARAEEVISRPKAAYTKRLLANVMKLNEAPSIASARSGKVIFTLENIAKKYATEDGKDKTTALEHLSLKIYDGELLGIAGESGCGKSTLARLLLGLEKPDDGRVVFRGADMAQMSGPQRRAYFRQAQMVFQEPASTFSPRMKIGAVLREPLKNFRLKRPNAQQQAVKDALEGMLLPAAYVKRYPHELSGGELQRVSLARCLEIRPEIIIYDEPTSALDATIQKQVLEDISKTHAEHGLTSILISHDIALLRQVCSRIAVLYRGHVAEILRGEERLSDIRHPYTRELFGAAYTLDANAARPAAISEDCGSGDAAAGCVYYGRCGRREEACRQSMPALTDYGGGHMCACFLTDGGNDDLLG
ncbi:peptide/nickel transport system ATP-binding protein [Sporobacter termitidis DSM 10068]|uniref:Peptide/nickel transport system ATP-binding protein n=1 Tax=Sporobacter termitidis DSM 10068 TaxID=1123282 RepID=A0A1M5XCY8_9FIRM|nr:ABC transporter ATP-binding protein [Sporobacter termitidis]SHH97636.1 peptide/nickel transport system ATP-binding protein [Sporobacter termitidis DSM 10068]